ncbi:hypothetical protein [Paraburkholderia atlantica]|nr:hypothetical protein [Paraburkholderia atlantica]
MIAAVMASMAMVAIEATIVSTAMPQIVSQLRDLRRDRAVMAKA